RWPDHRPEGRRSADRTKGVRELRRTPRTLTLGQVARRRLPCRHPTRGVGAAAQVNRPGVLRAWPAEPLTRCPSALPRLSVPTEASPTPPTGTVPLGREARPRHSVA